MCSSRVARNYKSRINRFNFWSIKTLIIMSIGLNSLFVLAESNKTMNSEFQRVNDSFRGGEMIFSCRNNGGTFKITTSAFSEPKIYWKSGIEWDEIDDAEFKDPGVIFRGLGRNGGAPLKDMVIELELPIFKKNIGGRYTERKAGPYFIKSRKGAYVPQEYVIDMFESRITSINMYPIVDYVKLDDERYQKEQQLVPLRGFTRMDGTFSENTKEVQARAKKISAVIKSFEGETKVTTPSRSVESNHYCDLMA